jgi:hypothetical protein
MNHHPMTSQPLLYTNSSTCKPKIVVDDICPCIVGTGLAPVLVLAVVLAPLRPPSGMGVAYTRLFIVYDDFGVY